ncbi:cell envelope biogenesis protein OmpA [Patiriisocius marinistellae]|uniref:Cell envelope biogenesis protein OmpA n=1 Tax=Patiriisocius marinistellae TaxID=2494560 RepID=A0A5J4G055_9FLAO|nr:OmpA family protein [Patiriisocius marinistellae]GEQ86874.1 cell envelope biogenesis protein OmpA [Patiriisocius marinistellae]
MKAIKNSSKLLLITLAFLCAGVSFSQENKIKKADKEFDRYAYIDARAIYLKVVEDGFASAEIFKKLGDTYYWNSDYDNAAKWYGRLIDTFPNDADASYYLRAAQSYKSVNNYDESDKLMEIYAEMTGDNLVIKNFEENKSYLSIIAFLSKNYELEKVSINSPTSDFGAAYYGNQIVFASAEGTTGSRTYEWTDQPYLDLFVADKDSLGRLTNKTPLSNAINTGYHESSAAFTKDGNTMYFTRNNFIKGKAGKDKDKTVRLKLYYATKGEDGNWDNVKEMPFNSKEYSTAHPALSADEKKLYFASDMPGTLGMSDLYFVEIEGDGVFGTPVNLGPSINTEARETYPFISKVGNLYFATDGRPGLGGFDIFSTPITAEGAVGAIKNIGIPANSNQDDFGIIIDEKKNLGYLTSNRDGEQGSVNDEIYRVQFSKCKIDIAGIVVDKNTGLIIPRATVVLLDSENKEISRQEANDKAEFSFPNEECMTQYTVRASKTGYEPNEEIITTPNQSVKLSLKIPLTPLKVATNPCADNDLGCRLNLQPIYFDFDKSYITAKAEVELAKILAAMRLYPELIIHIESHTDSRATFSYNERLSERRAQSTLQWLINRGIEPRKLTARGYGENRLTNRCKDGVECTEDEHDLNRRSVFLIQNGNENIDNSANEREQH